MDLGAPHDTGTHRGPFFDVPATGREVRVEEFAVYRVEAGRIAEVWGMDFAARLLVAVSGRLGA